MLGAQARFIPESNHQESNPILSRDSNSNPDSAEQPLRRNNNFKPQPQPQLDSRSLDSNPIRFNPRSPAPTSLPRPRDEPNHLRLSNRDFQKGLQKRNLQKQRRKGSPTDYDLLIGPFHASNEEDVKEKREDSYREEKMVGSRDGSKDNRRNSNGMLLNIFMVDLGNSKLGEEIRWI